MNHAVTRLHGCTSILRESVFWQAPAVAVVEDHGRPEHRETTKEIARPLTAWLEGIFEFDLGELFNPNEAEPQNLLMLTVTGFVNHIHVHLNDLNTPFKGEKNMGRVPHLHENVPP